MNHPLGILLGTLLSLAALPWLVGRVRRWNARRVSDRMRELDRVRREAEQARAARRDAVARLDRAARELAATCERTRVAFDAHAAATDEVVRVARSVTATPA